jgi:cobyrinic acid a,c-diamide synthase
MPGLRTDSLARLVIAAPQGKSGKTTISLGLCAAFARRGLRVQPFKKGPDYIDPSWLSAAAGRACRTLDPFFSLTPEALKQAFITGASQADLALVEGNHGLYDSALAYGADLENPPGEENSGSTAAVARQIQAPILLVINAARMGRSAAALVTGCQVFEADTPIRGVIVNNVANGRHEAKLRKSIETCCGIPVVGALPRAEELAIPDRHLGLVPQGEQTGLAPALEALRQAAEQHLDLEHILEIANTAPAFDDLVQEETTPWRGDPRVRIGVVRDRAFSFYYPENLEALEAAGAELVFINALRDSNLPAVHTLYIGGGFPEMFLEELEANRALRQDVRDAAHSGLPVYAECGGLMYLSQRVHWGDRQAEMAGVLPFDVEMCPRPQGHGYVLAETQGRDPFFPSGALLRGHEFHHSRVTKLKEESSRAYRLIKGSGLGHGVDGLVQGQALAGYTHLHAAGSPAWAPGLVARAAAYKEDLSGG